MQKNSSQNWLERLHTIFSKCLTRNMCYRNWTLFRLSKVSFISFIGLFRIIEWISKSFYGMSYVIRKEIVNALSVGSLINWIFNLLSLAYYRERYKDDREKLMKANWKGIKRERYPDKEERKVKGQKTT